MWSCAATAEDRGAGVAILVERSWSQLVVGGARLIQGRALGVVFQLQEMRLGVICVYAPAQAGAARSEFWLLLLRRLRRFLMAV